MDVRLQKFIADAGIMSRRAAEIEIEQGNVTVNGHPVPLGTKINPAKDLVVFLGKRVIFEPKKDYIYVMLNKPRGYTCTTQDPHATKIVLDLLTGIDARIYPVGRLDKQSEGLLLLTNNGSLTNNLTHPFHSIPKIYRVKVDGVVTDEQLEILSSPLEIDGYTIKPVRVEIFKVEDETTTLTFYLYEGRNRQIRKMCDQAHLTIRRLNRVAIGDLKLNGLASGKWRYLTEEELDYLKQQKLI